MDLEPGRGFEPRWHMPEAFETPAVPLGYPGKKYYEFKQYFASIDSRIKKSLCGLESFSYAKN